MTSAQVVSALGRWHKWNPRESVMVPNISWGLGMDEADLVVVSKARWLQEVEIKVSMSDFRKEFVHNSKAKKHRELVGGRTWGDGKHKVKHYWIAMPADLAAKVVTKGLVPAHAGVLAIPEKPGYSSRVQTLIEAPRLVHARALTEKEYADLLRLAYLRYWDLRSKEEARVAA